MGCFASGSIPDDDPRIDDARPFLVEDDRVEVELPDLRVLGKLPGHRRDDPDERLLVLLGLPPVSPDETVALDLPDHRADIVVGDGQDTDGDILEEFHELPAKSERDDLSKRGIGLPPDQHLKPAGHLLLYDDAGDRRFRGMTGTVLHDRPERLLYPFGALDRGDDAADIALVDDIRRDYLHDDRVAYPPGGRPCIAGAGDHLVGRHGYPAR
ncbi:MAG: hypothetical protein BWX50_00656 [Euryarchaeota archaeon ADurb.Bin009]|nr:MAG: hypothetical protein BWX50_00656 [Euryarchaeota archaeon ADurb.Bin009]